MKVLPIISLATVLIILCGGRSVAGGASQINPDVYSLAVLYDESEPLEFDEEGVVINLGYPNIRTEPARVALQPGEPEQAVMAISRVLPKLTGGFNVGLLHHMRMNERASAHVAGGAFFRRETQQSNANTDSPEPKEKGIDPMLQLGVTYKLTPGISITGEVQRYFRSDDEDIQHYAIGMLYNY